MSEGFRGILGGVRPVDWVLAGALTALGAVQMVADMLTGDTEVARAVATGEAAHAVDPHSWWMLPLWLVACAAPLWWRRGVLQVGGIMLGVVALHDLVFGWQGRCGSGLPLAFVIAFLGGIAYERTRAWATHVLALLTVVAVLVRDATAGLGAVTLALPVAVVVFVIARAVRYRTALTRELAARNDELRTVRDARLALEVDEDRAALSRELDTLLRERLDLLGRAARSGDDLDPEQTRALLAQLEADSRSTLEEMRRVVGQLRGVGGAAVTLAPVPAVAHLDALLARRSQPESRLTVTGDARTLSPAVELSAYRIVEHLLTVLDDAPDCRVDVEVRFARGALELRVHGPVERGADVRTALARARERARLLGGSVDLRVGRGQARAIALLPVAG